MINDAQVIYFAGIGGIGMSALAQLLDGEQKSVLGSDILESSVTEQLMRKGIAIVTTQDGSGITDDVDLVIYTSALPEGHPELVEAKRRKIPTLSYFQAVGEYMKGFKNAIAISGTHGKTTTTAMISKLLIDAGFDPTVIVGSIVKEFKSNARLGGKQFIVVEACEHKEHMLNLRPNMVVLTNIEEDHLDHYRDLEHIVMTFQKYINHLPKSGVLIKNSDDSESQELGFDGLTLTYGIENPADHSANAVEVKEKKQQFTSRGTAFELIIPGTFNVYNALAAITVGRQLGIADVAIKHSLQKFGGVWRRFEVLGNYKKAVVISDYAHHPTEVQSTIKAAREFYPERRLVIVFQPHQRSRTKKLFDKFVQSFSQADFVIIQEIYDVAGREEKEYQDMSSKQLVDAVEEQGKYALYSGDVAATRQEIDDEIDENDVLLIMGAGDIYKLAEELVQ